MTLTTKTTTRLAQMAVVLVTMTARLASASSGLLGGNSPPGKNTLEGSSHQGGASVPTASAVPAVPAAVNPFVDAFGRMAGVWEDGPTAGGGDGAAPVHALNNASTAGGDGGRPATA